MFRVDFIDAALRATSSGLLFEIVVWKAAEQASYRVDLDEAGGGLTLDSPGSGHRRGPAVGA